VSSPCIGMVNGSNRRFQICSSSPSSWSSRLKRCSGKLGVCASSSNIGGNPIAMLLQRGRWFLCIVLLMSVQVSHGKGAKASSGQGKAGGGGGGGGDDGSEEIIIPMGGQIDLVCFHPVLQRSCRPSMVSGATSAKSGGSWAGRTGRRRAGDRYSPRKSRGWRFRGSRCYSNDPARRRGRGHGV
jgi:hypothetical protein